MSAPVVNNLPTPPNSEQNQTEFTANANAHVAALTPWTDEVNALGEYVSDQSAIIQATGSGFVGSWSNQTGSASVPYGVSHNNRTWALNVDIADVTASEPSSTNSDWQATSVDTNLINIETGAAASIFIGESTGENDDGSNQNVGIGDSVLNANTSGSNNTAVGFDALSSNTIGGENTAFGSSSLSANITSSNNSAFGRATLSANVIGSSNSAFGSYCLNANTDGASGAAFGANALRFNTTGSNNSAFGKDSLYTNTTGFDNSSFGSESLKNNTTGELNSAFGRVSMFSNTTGSNNSAFGRQSLTNNTIGNDNSAFGYLSLTSNTEGLANCAFGRGSLDSNTTGNSNSGFGQGALDDNTTGSNNVAVGSNSAGGISTGSRNTIVGANTTLDAASDDCIVIGEGLTVTGSNKLNIGDVITGDLATGDASVSGSFGVGGLPDFSNFASGIDISDATSTGIRYAISGVRNLENYLSGTEFAYKPINSGIDFVVKNTSGENLFLIDMDSGDISSSGNILPSTDNSKNIGNSSFRMAELFAANGTINTSDETLKTPFESLTQTEKEAFLACKLLLGKFKWLDAVDKKGDDARIHIGVGAQSAIAEFTNRGLDWTKYSCFCVDDVQVYETKPVDVEKQVTITKQREKREIVVVEGIPTLTFSMEDYEEQQFNEVGVVDEQGEPVIVNDKQLTHKVPVMETVEVEEKVLVDAGQRYGVRYNELLAGIIAAME